MAPAGSNSPEYEMSTVQNVTYDKASEVLKQLQASAKRYQTLAARDTGICKPDWMAWMQDKKDLNRLNEAAMLMAARTINNLIVPTPKLKMNAEPEEANVVERLAWNMFDGVRPKDLNGTWGKIAQGQVRAFAGILRSMKED